MDFDAFHRGGGINGLPYDLGMMIDNQVQGYDLGMTTLTVCVDDSEIPTYTTSAIQGKLIVLIGLGTDAIGSGQRSAMLKLIALEQHQSKTIPETIFNVFCAKRVAELAPGVGQATTMKLIDKKGISDIDQSCLDRLVSLYDKQADSVDDSIRKPLILNGDKQNDGAT